MIDARSVGAEAMLPQPLPLAPENCLPIRRDLSLVPAQVSSDDEVQLVLSDWQGRQVVVAVVPPYKPDERSIWRRHDSVSPNAAVSAVELHDGEVRVRWAVAVRPSASAPIAKCAFYRRLDPTWRGQKEFSDPTREFVTAQIVV